MSNNQEKLAAFLRKSSEKVAEAIEDFDAEKARDSVVNKTTELYSKAKDITLEDVQNAGKAAVDKVKNFDVNDYNLDVQSTIPKVLAVSANIIDREEFLKDSIGEYVSEETLEKAIATSTKEAGVRRKLLDMVADQAMSSEVNKASGVSMATGSTWATLPADIVQYFSFVIRIVQKLAYLYGHADFNLKTEEGEEFPEESLTELTRLIGIMFDAGDEEGAVGSKMGKLTLAKGVAAPIPIVGGVLSGGMTYATLKPYANRLKNTLSEQYGD